MRTSVKLPYRLIAAALAALQLCAGAAGADAGAGAGSAGSGDSSQPEDVEFEEVK